MKDNSMIEEMIGELKTLKEYEEEYERIFKKYILLKNKKSNEITIDECYKFDEYRTRLYEIYLIEQIIKLGNKRDEK